MRDRLDFGGRAHGLIGGKAALGVDQVGREDGVDQCGLAQTGLSCIKELSNDQDEPCEKDSARTNTHHIKLETTLQQLPLNLGGDAIETDMAVGEDGGLLTRGRGGSGSHCGGKSQVCEKESRE